MQVKKKFLATLLAGVFLVAGCTTDTAKDSAGTESKEKNEIVLAAREINYTLDPTKSLTDGYLRRISVAEAMFLVSKDGKVIPGFIKDAKQIDANTWELYLRENAKFQSGKLVKAEEIIASVERVRKLSADGETVLKGLTFSKKDDYTVLVKTEKANHNVPLSLTEVTVQNADMDYTTVATADFTGMYKIVEYIPKQKTVLAVNENYWGTKPKIQKVIYEEIGDDDTRILKALNGSSDITTDIIPINAKKFQDKSKFTTYTVLPSGTLAVYLNLKKPFLSDVRVRQALNWALDRDQIASINSEGFGKSTSTWLGTNPSYTSENKKVYDKQDVQKAEALLTEAGFTKNADGMLEKDGVVFKFKMFTWGADKLLGELVQDAWRKIGIDVELSHVDYSLIESARQSGEWDGFIETWGNFGDMYSVLSKQFIKGGSINYADYENPEVTDLINSLRDEADPQKIMAISKKVNEITAIDAPLVPLTSRVNITVTKKALTGYVENFMHSQPILNANLSFMK